MPECGECGAWTDYVGTHYATFHPDKAPPDTPAPAPPPSRPVKSRAPRAPRRAREDNPIALARALAAVEATRPRVNPLDIQRRLRAVEHVTQPGFFVKETDHAHAKLAVEAWHYTRKLPAVTDAFGVWEDGDFKGCVMFGPGATPELYKPFREYGVEQKDVCELVRVALRDHKTPVSKILAVVLKLLRKKKPHLKLVMSFADPKEGHHGGIYQASGWTYLGPSKGNRAFFLIDGKIVHPRSVVARYGTSSVPKLREIVPEARSVLLPAKHRYAFPFEPTLKAALARQAVPHPKRA